MMARSRWLLRRLGLLGCLLVVGFGRPCGAREPIVEFLRGLQQRGYGEQSLEYLSQIARRPDLPDELKRTLDLERSKSLRLAAREANDGQQRASRLAEAKRLAEKFFADNPEHPAAPAMLLDEADEALARGQNHLALSRGSEDKEIAAKALADARTAFTSARKQFETIAERFKEKLSALPKPADGAPATGGSGREELEAWWVEARFKISLADYSLAQTYDDRKDRQRLGLLKNAGEAFDALYQAYRGKRVSLMAHLWHGRTLEELGDTALALDFYDEVLAADPEGIDPDPELAPLFGQAQLQRMRLVGAITDPKSLILEGDEWLLLHKRWELTPQYQGIELETAKARLKAAEQTRINAEKVKFMREALAALAAIGKVNSEYRQEALVTRRQAIAKLGTGGALTFEECIAMGDEALAERNWTSAEALFRQAGELARKANDAKRSEAARLKLAQALYRQATTHYAAGKMDNALSLAGEIVKDNPNDPVAEDASAVALGAALQLFADSPEDKEAQARLQRVTDYAISRWPDKPVADDSRMTLAQAALIRGDFDAALERLSEIKSQSKRYSTALQVFGQVRWKQYLEAKRAPDAEERAAEIQKLRAEAVEKLRDSVQRQRASWQPGSEPMPAALFDTQLLFAETHLEADQHEAAAELFQALVKEIERVAPTSVDLKGQRALVGAVRSQVATGKASEAASAAQLLVQISHDEAQPNAVLVDLAKLVGIEISKVEAAGGGTEGVGAALTATSPALAPLREVQGVLLDALYSRKELSVPQLIFIGDACVSLEKGDKARDVYQRVLELIDKDETAKATAGAATTRIRARLVSLLRSENKLDDAFKQVESLIQTHPNALEPLMEKGYILQSLSERDPRRLEQCVAHWTDLRLRLGRLAPRPPEYYEVLYNAALCLLRQARHANSQEKALQAEQMLKSTMTLSPKLSGPDMVAKYEALLKYAATMRSGPAATTSTKSPR
jgi:hypothetical protein